MTRPQRPLARVDLTVVELDGEMVVYEPASGDLHYLNATASLVFSLCDGTATARELARDIADAFTQPPDEVERQVRTVLRAFRRQHLLAPAFEGVTS